MRLCCAGWCRWLLPVVVLLVFAGCSPYSAAVKPSTEAGSAVSTDRLNQGELVLLKRIMAKLESMIEGRERQGSQAILTFEELYQPLDGEEKAFVMAIAAIRPESIGIKTPYQGYGTNLNRLVRLDQSYRNSSGVPASQPAQYLPEPVHVANERMMAAMQRDLGRRLYVASGHRSGAYQIYLFLYYLRNHDWSIAETARFVAFPGYSEHGNSSRQAIDYVNIDDISEQPGQFETLPEYHWLEKNAGCFGFVLSYPRNSPTGITFEPWHWHAEAALSCPGP